MVGVPFGEVPSMVTSFLAGLLAVQAGVVPAPRAMVVPPRATETVSRTYGVEISAGDQALWKGNLRVARDQSSSFSMNKAESGWNADCPPAQQRGSARSGLNLSLTSLGQARADEGVRVRVSWQRLVDQPACLPESGTRTVGLDTAATFGAGDVIELRGDAGLRVRITRH
jgi:hypothetical protein